MVICLSSSEKLMLATSQHLPAGLFGTLEEAMRDCRARHLSHATGHTAAYAVGRFLRWVAERGYQDLGEVKAEDVTAYFAEDKRSRNDSASFAGILRHYFSPLKRQDLAGTVPRLTFRYQDDFEVLNEDDIAKEQNHRSSG